MTTSHLRVLAAPLLLATALWDAGGPCLRLAIGHEDPADLIEDLADGLARLAG